MAWKILISSIILVTRFGCFTTENEFETKITDKGEVFSTTLVSCSVGAAQLKDTIKCNGDKGEKGNIGFDGIPGSRGPEGPPGPEGSQGIKGEMGENGPKGLVGDPGVSIKGSRGQKGETGSSEKGEKGDQGTQGQKGRMGLIGTCPELPVIKKKKEEDDDGDSIGETDDNPANFLCHTNVKTLKGDVWVYKEDSFQIRCQEKKTCFILKPLSNEYIQENSINYGKEADPFWLSNKSFDLTKFYNNVTMKQIAFIQSKSTQVIQKIKYHCKNSYIAESSETALLLYSWNDLTIGPNTSEFSPLNYSLTPDSHACTEKGSKTKWENKEIVVTGSSKRLPVIDFHVRDIRREDQSFYLELTELCFE